MTCFTGSVPSPVAEIPAFSSMVASGNSPPFAVRFLPSKVIGVEAPIKEEFNSLPNYMITQLDTIEPIPCPCGFARRAFTGNEVASLHLVDISVDSQVHYHKKLTEIYLVIEGEGHIELDGEVFPVKPMTAIFIKPGCRHRAVGNLRVINIPVPAFDSADEWMDEETVAADRGSHLGKADQGSVVSGVAIGSLDDGALDTADGRSNP